MKPDEVQCKHDLVGILEVEVKSISLILIIVPLWSTSKLFLRQTVGEFLTTLRFYKLIKGAEHIQREEGGGGGGRRRRYYKNRI